MRNIVIALLATVALAGAGRAAAETAQVRVDGPTPTGEQRFRESPRTQDDPAHRQFDDPETYARSWEEPERDAWQRPAALVDALGVEPGMTVADIGTGTGYLLPHLSRAAGSDGRVLAVDISPEMLDWVRDRAAREGLDNVETVRATGGASGLAAGTVDRAVMINVWHHIEDRDAYARDLHAAMGDGGVVFIVETDPESEHPGGPPAHYRLEPESVITELERAGFRARQDPFEIDRQYVIRAEH